ncbi:hypothetical protein [Horticoccus sp. 23ND18S-11]|uniref:hypothetical protein n=1 Tax=Horticoccus sp. 23ND18S-11 TaxID=3391832 RepID=UPI0039C93AD0
MTPGVESRSRNAPARSHALVAVLCCAGVAAFYLWTVLSCGWVLRFGSEQRDYYNLLIDGYLDGQLHMKVPVPESLLAVKDPYDPAQRPPGVGLHDASFYRGRYYVYFGAAPMVTLMLPFRLIAGCDLPLPLATLAFVLGGFLASVAVWLGVRHRYFPETGAAVVAAGIFILGVTAGGPILLRRPDMWELPIAGGYCFAMIALGCVWRSLHVERRRWLWFAAAALSYGLAIASRPIYLLASPLFAVPLIAWWRSTREFPAKLLLSAVLPLAFVGSLMAWHNYARFGDPLQFGQAYQLSLDYESKLPHFRAAYVPYTARMYFFSPAEWSSYYPFIHRGDLGVAPQGFTPHRGDVYGLLIHFPIAWLALLAPLAAWRRSREERRPLVIWLVTVAVQFALAATVLLFFFSALARYQSDFVPAFMLLAAVGLLALDRWLETSGGALRRTFGRLLWGGAAIASVLFGILFSLVFDGLLPEHNPALEARVARTLNQFPATVERLAGVRHGAVELTLRLPADARSGSETLFTRGNAAPMERVFLHTRTDGRVQFGWVRAGTPELLGAPLALDRTQSQRVRVTLGALLPPASHPFFGDRRPDEIRRALRAVRIDVDGQPVLVGHQRNNRVTPQEITLGAAAKPDPAYPPFRGAVTNLRRVDAAATVFAPPPVAFPGAGSSETIRLRVRLPAGRSGQREPLVATGRTGEGDLVVVEYVDRATVRFAFDHWGTPLRVSEPVRVDEAAVHTIEITLPSLRAVEDATLTPEPRTGRLRVAVDSRSVWEIASECFPAEAPEISVGRNHIGGTTGGPVFTGELIAVEPVARE